MPEGTKVLSHDHEIEHPEDGRRFQSRTRLFKLPFENGWTVTVEWGVVFARADKPFVEEPEAATVEVAEREGRVVIWDDSGFPVGRSLDHPGKLYDVPAERILQIIDAVETWPTEYLPIMDRV